MAYDGETAWHINEFYEIEMVLAAGVIRISSPFRQDLDLATPFFDYEERGLRGRAGRRDSEVDGIDGGEHQAEAP